MKKYFVKILNPMGEVVYIGKLGTFPKMIEQAWFFETKEQCDNALKDVKAHQRRGKFKKIGEIVVNKEKEQLFV